MYIWNSWQLHILALNVILNADTSMLQKKNLLLQFYNQKATYFKEYYVSYVS